MDMRSTLRTIQLTLFRLGFFGVPWTGVWRQTPLPLNFLKAIEGIDIELISTIIP